MSVLNEDLNKDKDAASKRENQEDPLVQYYIVHKNLKMSTGKIAAQIAHASMIFTLKHLEEKSKVYSSFPRGGSIFNRVKKTEKWLEGSFRKLSKEANTAKFNKIKEEFDCYLVKDAGLTEVESGSETVLVLFPMLKSETPDIIRKLRLL